MTRLLLAQPGSFPAGILDGMAGGLICLLVLIVSVVVGFFWFMHLKLRPPRKQRGFEVKPITGQPPVLREKEKNDHG